MSRASLACLTSAYVARNRRHDVGPTLHLTTRHTRLVRHLLLLLVHRMALETWPLARSHAKYVYFTSSEVMNGPNSHSSNSNFNVTNIHLLLLLPGDAVVQRYKAFRLAISRSRVQILLESTLRNNLRQVVYTYGPLSPSSIIWYRPKGGDALRLGR